ncbi:SNF1-interacting protein, partial [Ascosphaera acerosa]
MHPTELNLPTLTEAAAAAPRRETKQDREARRREKEQALRLAERERSMRDEHVDGGYLVALGIYVGHEDWNKKIVRRLIIDRRLAPYWRGLDDVDENWADHQLIAAARGLAIPDKDVVLPELVVSTPAGAPHAEAEADS